MSDTKQQHDTPAHAAGVTRRVLFGTAAATAGVAAATGIPFELNSNKVYLPVTLSDGKPRWFILDSGCPVTAVDTDVAAELKLELRNERQVAYTAEPVGDHVSEYGVGPRKRKVWLTAHDRARVNQFEVEGFTEAMRTPDNTLIFVTPEKSNEILTDQINCMGCLSACMFSNWAQNEEGTTGKKADPRSFCIQKTLQEISHSDDCETQLMFAGHNAYRFADDPFYSNGFIPTVKQLVDRIASGD